ncbi:type IV toxin-antitoxin system AbiEi family antitoxin domain-containing protein [Rhodococcus sp. BP-252]|uniref:type IV toxin-antitoxin system AbiEi family antitoxin domain-containing protein n=1 Tax=unclassified Rhodococcus (in: high G+C Gram-positive bacteria) TaxID=192944 RepID=UPI001C9A302B|nr:MULTISPECIES: type IV toxin-antitoxin system AbiEi family antitoxin domain-containing protein [unclassified Rhodococcus (in: high G+C Gram-positive bacteria)]MBY6420875.1 type IV toxin-antitoxin system AbiEi family antitoxin domain-containing protein [Rhodococcus sp. BP-324]MBY6425930.1 type IV toxin-antitoxin system AbiEi family antitoxin domain-containing protein [Rhodococcus sp. BP-323]MBY6430949.1 type IV toxin-antitoxin system AbiEi family antitoxin domain-containing protein [Rhodococcus
MRPDSYGLITRASALEAGYTDTELQRLCARGELIRMVPGIYVRPELFDSLNPRQKHRLRTIATLRVNTADAVASHLSAAVLHGLDMWDTDLTRVHLTIPGGSGRTTSGLHVHTGALSNESVTVSDGIRLTTLDRTVSDCARIVDLDHAAVIGDSALRSKKVSMDQLRRAIEASARSNGIGAARRAFAAMDIGSESPGETLSRLRMMELGMPKPVLQQVLRVKGRFLVRVDFYWKRWRVVGEIDGESKYDDHEDVVKEKWREDDLRDHGLEVIRWGWRDLWSFARVRDKFERACRRAERRR